MRLVTIKRYLVLFIVNKLLAGKSCFELKRKLLISIGYKIGEDTKIVGPIFCSAQLTIGKDCWIGKNLLVNGNGTVVIGDNCDIAPEVAFQTGGHEIGSSNRRAGKGIKYNINIGNGCWLGARSTILGGVTIGDACVVVACACVAKTVDPNSLVGGVPAKVIRVLGE